MTGHMDVIYSGTFSPDGLTLASASWDGTVRLWQVSTGQEMMVLQGGNGEIWSVAFAPDGKTLAAGRSSRHAGSEVLLWQGCDGPANRPAHLVARPEGRARRRSFLSGHAGAVNGLAYAPDGSFLASGSDDASVILWDPDSGTERRRLTGHSGPVDAVAVSPDSRLVASGAGDWHKPGIPGELWLWDPTTGERVAELSGHLGPVFSAGLHRGWPDPGLGSLDGTVKLWDVTARRERATLRSGLPGWVQALALIAGRANLAFANGGKLTSGTSSRGESWACWTDIAKTSTRWRSVRTDRSSPRVAGTTR